jgi:phosphotriesterase-related protein
VKRLIDVSMQTGISIIAATGMHTSKYYQGVSWADDAPDALARRFISEVVDGMDGTKSRAGVMKVAMSGEAPTFREEDLFDVAGRVHAATGVPVLTHCEDGRSAIRQIEMLTVAGVGPSSVLLSHTDKSPDHGYHREILGTGALVEYDQALRQTLSGSTSTADLTVAMWEEGFGDQILLGTDGARRSLWASLGGRPGLAWLRDGFPGLLRERGLGQSQIDTMFVENPARWLAFTPPG